MTYTDQQKKRILEYADANSLRKASKKYGASEASIRTWRKKHNGNGQPEPTIQVWHADDSEVAKLKREHAAMKKIIFEHTMEKYGIEP